MYKSRAAHLLAPLLFLLAAGIASADHHNCGRHHDCGGKRGGPPAFADFDANQDGSLSSQEYYEGRGRHMAERARAGGKMRNASSMPTFEDIDTDGDGKLSPEEFAAHHAERRQSRQ